MCNLDSALAALAVRGAQGLIVTSDGVYVAQGKALAEGAIKHGFPAIFVFRDQVRAGGLLATKVADLSRRGAYFVDRILKGVKRRSADRAADHSLLRKTEKWGAAEPGWRGCAAERGLPGIL
jgi:hypothetical protein